MNRRKSFLNQKNSKLYIVGTPIGNLDDISARALKTLNEVDVIYCEDTKNSVRLLTHFEIRKPLFSLHDHNENIVSKDVIKRIKNGENVAYISDAGNPGISDPGQVLIADALANNIDVVTVLGPSAFLHALINSGFDTTRFTFVGFLNRDDGKRKKELTLLKEKEETLIVYEAPHRISKLLKTINEVMPERRLCLGRELSKIHEEFIYGTSSELLSIPSEELKGEIVLVIEGNKEKHDQNPINDEEILEIYNELKDQMSTKDISFMISLKYNLKKNYIYNLIEKNKEN